MKKDGPMGQPFGGFGKKKGDANFQERMAFLKERAAIVKSEGAAVILHDSAKHFGLLQMSGDSKGVDFNFVAGIALLAVAALLALGMGRILARRAASRPVG